MSSETISQKITATHLSRRAVVYLRQSSTRQVRENLESQRLQYKLVDRARGLGWKQVEVIDTDLGASASIGAARRVGFDQLVGAVARGEVGIVLSRELSRLSRTDKDWCHLLEVCQLFDTLIGDEEQVYDVSLMDDQLVLGIKGTLSVVELKVLHLRMRQGQLEKARRGELLFRLPTGYVLDAAGRVVKDPDQRVEEAIALVFRKFRELWTIRQTFAWFREQGIDLPVNEIRGGRLAVVWKPPTLLFINHLLRNPFYAGAYFYGRRPTETVLVEGQLKKRTGRLRAPEQCRIFIREHHEGYIAWATFEENQRMIQRNSTHAPTEESVSTVRAGQGLLAGVLRCGHCGRRFHVRYWGRRGANARYFCKGDYEMGGRYCVSFGGTLVDRRFGQELLAALSPLGVQASLEAIEHLGAVGDERAAARRRQCEQLEYEAARAFEQYNQVDPRHRLVAAELERRWNLKLEELERTRAALAAVDRPARPLHQTERERILDLGERFEEMWFHKSCPVELKKKIVRTAVKEIVATLSENKKTLRFIVHWTGGTHTQFEMAKPQSPFGRQTSIDALDVIRRMAVRYGDNQIAAVLNRLGLVTGKGKRWNQIRVATARRNHSIAGQSRPIPDPDVLNLSQAAKYCGVSNKTIERLVAGGLIPMRQLHLRCAGRSGHHVSA